MRREDARSVWMDERVGSCPHLCVLISYRVKFCNHTRLFVLVDNHVRLHGNVIV